MKALQLLTIAFVLVFVSCEKTIEDPYERVEGKWIIENTSIGAISQSGNGSYLQFDFCGGACTGVDYNANDTTSGTFEFSISESSSVTTFNFTDTTNDGGWYNGEYEATLFTNSTLNLQAESILGTARIEMKKE